MSDTAFCLFCGSANTSISYSARLNDPSPAYRFVECEECSATGPNVMVEDLGDEEATRRAIQLWNVRGKA